MIFALIGLFSAILMYLIGYSWRVVVVISTLIVFSSYIFLPVINWYFLGLPIILCFIGIPGFRHSLRSACPNYPAIVVFVTGLMFFTIIPLITTWSFFYAKDYGDLIGKAHCETMSETDLTPIIEDRTYKINKQRARELGEARLAARADLKNYALGEMNPLYVDGQLRWIGPLTYTGPLNWWFNKNRKSAYISVSSLDAEDAQLVRQVDGEPIYNIYQDSAWFQRNIARHVYQQGYHEKGVNNFHFEVDDDGRPYWIGTLYKNTIGYSGEDTYGVLVVDAKTGHIQEFTADSAPDWVDHFQPERFIKQQLGDWFRHIPTVEGEDKDIEKMSLAHSHIGKAYWRVSQNQNDGMEKNQDVILVNARTKSVISNNLLFTGPAICGTGNTT